MLKQAYENSYDSAILVSGDGDFCPVVEYVKELGKEVENVYFADSASYALINKCNISKPVAKKLIKRCFLQIGNKL